MKKSLPEMVFLAKKIAEKEFKGKVDKAGQPYIKHIKRVADSVDKDEEKIVAFLHDIIEDCEGWSKCKIANIFNLDIAEAVELLTKKSKVPYELYIDNISKNKIATMVKLADLKDNMNLSRFININDSDLQRNKKYQNSYEYLKSKIT